ADAGSRVLPQRRAASPFAAWRTSKPASRKDSTSTSRTSASSSAISTRMKSPCTCYRPRLVEPVWRACSHPERIEARDVTADDEGVDVVRAFVRVDGLQIHHVPDH